MKQTIYFILLLLNLAVLSFAQTPQVIEQTLVKNLKELEKYSSYGSSYDEEKNSKANAVFENNLLKYTKNAASLNYKFPSLGKLMQIATSEDGKFRIYSWDTETGGTMHDYSRIYQFKGADGKVYSRGEPHADEDGGAGSFVYSIYSVDSKNGKIYIVCSNFIGSTNDHFQSADLYKIEGNTLKDKVKLIKTSEGMTDTLNFEYNFFSVVERKERPIKLILFDKKTNTLKIPIVVNTKEFPNGKVTNKFISYRFSGNCFEKVK